MSVEVLVTLHHVNKNGTPDKEPLAMCRTHMRLTEIRDGQLGMRLTTPRMRCKKQPTHYIIWWGTTPYVIHEIGNGRTVEAGVEATYDIEVTLTPTWQKDVNPLLALERMNP